MNFSQKHSQSLKLDWKANYIAILDDLGAKEIKLSTYWDYIEPEASKYSFDDLDWQIEEAEKRNVQILLVIGMKTPRWPECYIPLWATNLDKKAQQEYILDMIKNVVLRYKDKKSIIAWQVENEIFLPFGECPWRDKKFLKKEVSFVKSLDNTMPVVVSDSGEYSLWLQAASIGDIVGITMYKKVWFKEIKMYISYFFSAVFYTNRANLIKKIFGKDISCVELQAEPWGVKLLYDMPLEEQKRSMNL
ncbi:MAG: endo-1,4-beta-xylanase [bacterium]